jgi:hypothetical protein
MGSVEGAATAVSVWKLFHKKDNPREFIEVKDPWPDAWGYAGKARTVYYASDKWQDDNEYDHYYHHHGANIRVWHPAGSHPWLADEPKCEVEPPDDAAVLGKCIALDVERHDTGEVERATPSREALLVCSPDRRWLFVVDPAAGVVAAIHGEGLTVEARGIVG